MGVLLTASYPYKSNGPNSYRLSPDRFEIDPVAYLEFQQRGGHIYI